MIDVVDNLLRALVRQQVPGLSTDRQVSFQPPDDDWRRAVATLTGPALNIYLADLREHRSLRSPEWQTTIANGSSSRRPAPARVDCHFVITAWSPAVTTAAIEPTVDEHLVLSQVLAALFAHTPLNAGRIYPPGSAALAAVPESLRDADLPMTVLPPDGFLALPYFWGAMGAEGRWKPVIYLVVTVPVERPAGPVGPPVTTRILEWSGTEAMTAIQIAGTLRRSTGGALAGASVQIETSAGVPLGAAITDAAGRFSFGALPGTPHRLRGRAAGLGESVRDVDIPSPTGEYDLVFG